MTSGRRQGPLAHVEEGIRLVARMRVAATPDQVAEELARVVAELPWLDAAVAQEPVSVERLAEIAGSLGAPLAALAGALAPPGARSRVAIASRFTFADQPPAHTLVRHEFELRVPPGLVRRAEATVLRALLRRAQATVLRRVRARVGLESLEAVGDRLARELLLALRADGPRTAAALGVALRMPAARVAKALGRLDAAGYTTRAGDLWSAAADTRPLEFPVMAGSPAVVSLIEGILARLPADAAEAELRLAGERFGRRLAAQGAPAPMPGSGVGEAAAQVAGALGRLGHQVGVERTADGAVLRPGSCPMRGAIRSDLRTLPFDIGMWEGLMRSALPDLEAGALQIDCSGCLDRGQPCTVRLSSTTAALNSP